MKKNTTQQLRFMLYDFRLSLLFFVKYIRSRIRFMWARLYIRKDEFHHSLDTDMELLGTMNEKQRERYEKDLYRRRRKAHLSEFQTAY